VERVRVQKVILSHRMNFLVLAISDVLATLRVRLNAAFLRLKQLMSNYNE